MSSPESRKTVQPTPEPIPERWEVSREERLITFALLVTYLEGAALVVAGGLAKNDQVATAGVLLAVGATVPPLIFIGTKLVGKIREYRN